MSAAIDNFTNQRRTRVELNLIHLQPEATL